MVSSRRVAKGLAVAALATACAGAPARPVVREDAPPEVEATLEPPAEPTSDGAVGFASLPRLRSPVRLHVDAARGWLRVDSPRAVTFVDLDSGRARASVSRGSFMEVIGYHPDFAPAAETIDSHFVTTSERSHTLPAIWDLRLDRLRMWEGNTSSGAVAGTPDGRWILIGDRVVRLRDGLSGEIVGELRRPERYARAEAVTITPDGERCVMRWHNNAPPHTRVELRRLPGFELVAEHAESTRVIELVHDPLFRQIGFASRELTLRSLDDLSVQREIPLPPGYRRLGWSADGRWIWVLEATALHVYSHDDPDLERHTDLSELFIRHPIPEAVFAPDGAAFLRVHNAVHRVDATGALSTFLELTPYGGGVRWVPALSPDGTRLTVLDSDAVLVVDARTGGEVARLPTSGDDLRFEASLAPDASAVALSYRGRDTLVLGPSGIDASPCRTRAADATWPPCPSARGSLRPPGPYVFASCPARALIPQGERGLTIFDRRTEEQTPLSGTEDERAYQDDHGDTHHAAFNADGTQVAVVNGRTLRVFDASSGRRIHRRRIPEAYGVEFVGDEDVSCLIDRDVWLLVRPRDGRRIRGFRGSARRYVDGDLVTALARDGVHVYDLGTGEHRTVIDTPSADARLSEDRRSLMIFESPDEVSLYTWPEARRVRHVARPGAVGRDVWSETSRGFEALTCQGGELRRFTLADATERRLADCAADAEMFAANERFAVVVRPDEARITRIADAAVLRVRARRLESGERVVLSVADDGSFQVEERYLSRVLVRGPGHALRAPLETPDARHPRYAPWLVDSFFGSAERAAAAGSRPTMWARGRANAGARLRRRGRAVDGRERVRGAP